MDNIHLRTPPFTWSCGHCGQTAEVDSEHYHSGYRHIAVTPGELGETALVHSAVSCPNPGCRKLTLAIRLAEYKPSLGHAYPIGTAGKEIENWNLMPPEQTIPSVDEEPKSD